MAGPALIEGKRRGGQVRRGHDVHRRRHGRRRPVRDLLTSGKGAARAALPCPLTDPGASSRGGSRAAPRCGADRRRARAGSSAAPRCCLPMRLQHHALHVQRARLLLVEAQRALDRVDQRARRPLAAELLVAAGTRASRGSRRCSGRSRSGRRRCARLRGSCGARRAAPRASACRVDRSASTGGGAIEGGETDGMLRTRLGRMASCCQAGSGERDRRPIRAASAGGSAARPAATARRGAGGRGERAGRRDGWLSGRRACAARARRGVRGASARRSVSATAPASPWSA